MRRWLATSVLAVSILLGLPTLALAAGTLDQQQTTYDGFSGNSTQCIAQTFTAGLSGHLDTVSLYVRKLTDHPVMLIEIRDTVSGGPGSTVLASDSVPGTEIATTFGWIDFEFATPPIVVAGTTYAIVALALGPMGPEPGPWGFEWGGAQQSPSVDPYPGGGFFSANTCDGPYGAQSADLAFQTFVDTEGAIQPDARIRVNFDAWTGNNVYNATGDGQAVQKKANPRNWVLFRIRIQNDGFVRERFTVDADGTEEAEYKIRYFRRTTEITSAVVAGTYQTRWLAPGSWVTVEAWVKATSAAAVGSSVSRLITVTSASDPTRVDAVRLTLQRR